jgi:hypothetical protein
MTYQELLDALRELTPEQLASEVTVELGPEDRVYPAEPHVCSPEHFALADYYPVIFVP